MSDDRAAILRRRASFVAAALASAGVGLGGCDRKAEPALATSTASAPAASLSAPEPAPAQPPAPPASAAPDAGDAGAPDAGDDAGAPDAGKARPPQPPARVCLSRPQKCLSIARPRPPFDE